MSWPVWLGYIAAITHLSSTIQVRRRLTSLMRPTTLLLSQTGTNAVYMQIPCSSLVRWRDWTGDRCCLFSRSAYWGSPCPCSASVAAVWTLPRSSMTSQTDFSASPPLPSAPAILLSPPAKQMSQYAQSSTLISPCLVTTTMPYFTQYPTLSSVIYCGWLTVTSSNVHSWNMHLPPATLLPGARTKGHQTKCHQTKGHPLFFSLEKILSRQTVFISSTTDEITWPFFVAAVYQK